MGTLASLDAKVIASQDFKVIIQILLVIPFLVSLSLSLSLQLMLLSTGVAVCRLDSYATLVGFNFRLK